MVEDTTATNYRQVMQANVGNTLSPQIRVRKDQDHKKLLGCIWFLGGAGELCILMHLVFLMVDLVFGLVDLVL